MPFWEGKVPGWLFLFIFPLLCARVLFVPSYSNHTAPGMVDGDISWENKVYYDKFNVL